MNLLREKVLVKRPGAGESYAKGGVNTEERRLQT